MLESQQLPPFVSHLFKRLPAFPGSVMLSNILNFVLLPRMPADTLAALQERILRVHVRDAPLTFDFQYLDGRFRGVKPGTTVELTIAATAYDFYLLARRREDPDTLFFSRRLTMEGDTELGLLIKNTLDSLDLTDFDPARLFRESAPQFLRNSPLGRQIAKRSVS